MQVVVAVPIAILAGILDSDQVAVCDSSDSRSPFATDEIMDALLSWASDTRAIDNGPAEARLTIWASELQEHPDAEQLADFEVVPVAACAAADARLCSQLESFGGQLQADMAIPGSNTAASLLWRYAEALLARKDPEPALNVGTQVVVTGAQQHDLAMLRQTKVLVAKQFQVSRRTVTRGQDTYFTFLALLYNEGQRRQMMAAKADCLARGGRLVRFTLCVGVDETQMRICVADEESGFWEDPEFRAALRSSFEDEETILDDMAL